MGEATQVPSDQGTGAPAAGTSPNVIPSADVVVTPPDDPGPWYEPLPEAYRTNPAITRYTSLEEYVKAGIELEKRIGEKAGVQFPDAEASASEWAAFYKQTPGFPQTPGEYNVQPPKWPEDSPFRISDEAYVQLLGDMHLAGVPGHHVDKFVRWFEANETQRWEAVQQEEQEVIQRGQEQLERLWGIQTDYKVAVAEEGLRREFNDLEFLDQLVTKDPQGRDQLLRQCPEFIKIAFEWAESRGHAQYVAGAPGGPASVAQAQQQMDQAYADYREGKIDADAFSAVQARLGPIIHADADVTGPGTLDPRELEDR